MHHALETFLRETRDGRERKRATAVKLCLDGMPSEAVAAKLRVAQPLVLKWCRLFDRLGVSGLCFDYEGSESYLTPEDREQVMSWLQANGRWDVPALRAYLFTHYKIEYKTAFSYHNMMRAAGLSPTADYGFAIRTRANAAFAQHDVRR
jgi:putative transposase